MPWFVDVIELLRYNGAAVVPYNKPRSRPLTDTENA